jgi:hypothetical protein
MNERLRQNQVAYEAVTLRQNNEIDDSRKDEL